MKNQFKIQIGDKVEKLQKKSESVISVFTKTVNELVQVDNEIDTEIGKRQQEITELQAEVDALTVTKSKNESVVNRIKAFFEQ